MLSVETAVSFTLDIYASMLYPVHRCHRAYNIQERSKKRNSATAALVQIDITYKSPFLDTGDGKVLNMEMRSEELWIISSIEMKLTLKIHHLCSDFFIIYSKENQGQKNKSNLYNATGINQLDKNFPTLSCNLKPMNIKKIKTYQSVIIFHSLWYLMKS